MSRVQIIIIGVFISLASSVRGNDSQQLFLTPYILDGKIQEARDLAVVKPFLENVKSYSGFITINEIYKSHVFFWFFTSTTEWTTAPLIVYLQGGLGVTFMYGLFTGNGPYILEGDQLDYKRYSWTDHFNVLYIESPVGTGFSFIELEGGYSTNLTQVGEDLHDFTTVLNSISWATEESTNTC